MSAKKDVKKKRINWTRVLCFILAILMVGGMATIGITLLLNNKVAALDTADIISDYSFSSETDGDTYIAVGLMYGTSITVGFEVKAPFGFVVGKTLVTDSERSFEPIYYIPAQKVSVTIDSDLYKKSMTYYLTDDPSVTVVGGYHIELSSTISEELSFEYLLGDIRSKIGDDNVCLIPTRIKDCNRVRVGAYSSLEEAQSAFAAYSSLEDYSAEVVSPTNSAVSVIDPETDAILFEYDYGSAMDNLGLVAYQADEYASYIQTPANNNYEGVMMFVPKHTDTATGVSLINLLDLESYVEGVLPYEISNSWNSEVLRTFAITIRSYAISNYCKWYGKYGFDLTSTASDQVYRGRNRVNDAVVKAVASTEGLVTVYDGKICSAYYSSSVGGSTVASQYVWGSARGHLSSVKTPWERYADYNNGLWHTEVSPEDLCNTLRTKGAYTELSGAIASITVERAADNPDYVYSAVFTDTNGTSVTVRRCDNVRSVLSSYVKSANFIVGQNSLDFSYDKVYDIRVIGSGGQVTPKPPKDDKKTASYRGYITENQLLISEANVITSEDDTPMPSEYPVAYVLTSTGRKVIMNSCVASAEKNEFTIPFGIKDDRVVLEDPEYIESEIIEDNAESEETTATVIETEPVTTEPVTTTTPIGDNVYEVTSDFGNVTIITTLETVTETITASKSGNFIFAGKGWGHGVGISQYGAKDLADAGATAEEILSIYFNDISIIHRDNLR